tara:strand:+ start:287 stop:505 length:219 start_codon:yes stop_codon:yes gene_type:complete
MAKVSAHVGFTFRIGDLDLNQYGRVDVNINDIDTELPIDTQLEEAQDTVDKVFAIVKSKVDTQVDDMLDGAA